MPDDSQNLFMQNKIPPQKAIISLRADKNTSLIKNLACQVCQVANVQF